MSRPEITLRSAVSSDLDSITHVVLAAMPDDPIWPYCFPYAGTYPFEHYQYTRVWCSGYLTGPNAGLFKVILAESGSTVIAVAIWQLYGGQSPSTGGQEHPETLKPLGSSERPDCDPVRMEVIEENLAKFKTLWFDEKYGDNQLYLGMLCTHREHRRHGAATKLVQWGIGKAKEEKLTLALFSSPMGKDLYLKLGFKQIGVDKAQVQGDPCSIKIIGMVHDP